MHRRREVVFPFISLAPEEDFVYDIPQQLRHVPSFKVAVLAAIACHRFHRTLWLSRRLLRGTPVSRLRSCVLVIVSLERLRSTLPLHRARRTKYLLSMQRYSSSHHNAFRSYGCAIVFCLKLVHKLHERHTQCDPLQIAIDTISEALNFKLEQGINSGKCKVLLEVFSSISSLLVIMRFVLDNLKHPLDMGAYKGLSACYYSLKELCRMLKMCKQYIQDCSGSVPSRQVFAKLENVHTIKFLLLDLYKQYQLLVLKFDGFANSICDTVAKEFAWDCSPPCLPGSFMGHYLQLQAEKDLSEVLAKLKRHPKSLWSILMGSWRNILNPAEDIVLGKLLLERLKYPITEYGDVEYLKGGMFVDKKHIKLVRFLGSGTYGKVEEVLCFGEKYAMKTIKGLRAVEDANEAVIQARLHHPNIVKLMWYTRNFDSQNSLSLLMDLMVTSLEDYIEQQAYSSTRSRLFHFPLVSLNIMMQIAKAMRYLHSQGEACGKPNSTAFVEGGYWLLEGTRDVYSFAMTCYEIITGRKPFSGFLEDGMKHKLLVPTRLLAGEAFLHFGHRRFFKGDLWFQLGTPVFQIDRYIASMMIMLVEVGMIKSIWTLGKALFLLASIVQQTSHLTQALPRPVQRRECTIDINELAACKTLNIIASHAWGSNKEPCKQLWLWLLTFCHMQQALKEGQVKEVEGQRA
ncbi:hypothetical protein GOP47_0004186 [Adiantum capillus-veneris]|uniref:Protein kinase domain-containing protein n=1 Tax=Adiantum capillus-veneris TaxID=13818 RepID=A0A9D4V8D8_ADICA|nr:hypothetical protein GOP47_0004186 [Adiantum capillus-veneris]